MRNITGINNPFYGKHHTPDTKNRISAKNFKGGITESTGYLRCNKTKKMIHRMIMERHLGRALSPQEIVHHKNGDRKDNAIKNLMVITRAAHVVIHRKLIEYRNCEYCQGRFGFTPHLNKRFCSQNCYYKSRKKIIERACINCGKTFYCKPSDPKKKCSRLCHLTYLRKYNK